jgi:WXXGXW repeat (2 copies)
MKLFTVKRRAFAMAVFAALALSACVVVPAHRQAVYTTYPVYSQPAAAPAVDIVEVAPPAPQVEVIPVAPFARAVWVGGFWRWQAGRHYWVPGHYIQPVAGHRFVPHRWESTGARWVLRGGFWIR